MFACTSTVAQVGLGFRLAIFAVSRSLQSRSNPSLSDGIPPTIIVGLKELYTFNMHLPRFYKPDLKRGFVLKTVVAEVRPAHKEELFSVRNVYAIIVCCVRCCLDFNGFITEVQVGRFGPGYLLVQLEVSFLVNTNNISNSNSFGC